MKQLLNANLKKSISVFFKYPSLICLVNVFVLFQNNRAHGQIDIGKSIKEARRIAKISVDLSKQLSKVKSQYQYDELVKQVPTANLGFFMAHQFRFAGLESNIPDKDLRGFPTSPPQNLYASLENGFHNPNSGSILRDTLEKGGRNSILQHLGWEAGVELIGKGGKYADVGFSYKVSMLYLQIPIHIVYNYDLPKGSIYGGLGPYLAYGLAGKIKDDQDDTKAFDKELGFKRFDAGAAFTVGYWFNDRIVASLQYDLGLANISRDPEFQKTRNRSFGLNLGYLLGAARK